MMDMFITLIAVMVLVVIYKKFIKSYTLNMCSLMHINYNSAKLGRQGGCDSCSVSVSKIIPFVLATTDWTTSYFISPVLLCNTGLKGSRCLRVFVTLNSGQEEYPRLDASKGPVILYKKLGNFPSLLYKVTIYF